MATDTRVPLLDLTRGDPGLLDELRQAFERVLLSGRYIMGPELADFESECAAFIGVEHALGVSSGTDALVLALMALGVGSVGSRGPAVGGSADEVICPSYSFFATAGSVWRVGARPVFVDIDPLTYNCDPVEIAARIGPHTRAIMPVHLYGQCADLSGILAAAGDIPVIEDAAQAIGARSGDRQAGSVGAFGCFSFFPSKNLGCLGDGGLLTTNDATLAETARIMRVHGGEPKYYHRVVGGNFRMDPLQAAFLRAKLPRLPGATEGRRRNANLYRELFAAAGIVAPSPTEVEDGRIGLPAQPADHTYNQFVIRSSRRDELRDWLTARGVGVEIYYPVPLHAQECFASLGHRAGEFPHSERAANETLALPIFPELTEAELRYVVSSIVTFCGGKSTA